MKVKVSITRDVVIDINDPCIKELDNFWRENSHVAVSVSHELADKIEKATKAVENAVGIPFGNNEAFETIYSVCAMDGEPILEW